MRIGQVDLQFDRRSSYAASRVYLMISAKKCNRVHVVDNPPSRVSDICAPFGQASRDTRNEMRNADTADTITP